MKIIFSRKGFDSTAGGSPSPIVRGHPISIPIPAKDRSETTYADLGLADIVEHMTKGRHTGESLCHNDPMFEKGYCYFGQTGVAQSHLGNQDVAPGDVFLFFGLFSRLDGSDRHHRIFGYLKIEEVQSLGSSPQLHEPLTKLRNRHPHTLGKWNENNTLYFGKGETAKSAPQQLRLSKPGEKVSLWQIPPWLQEAQLSYHRDPRRWLAGNTLRVVSRGQEFVTNASERSEAIRWLNNVLKLIDGC